MLRRLSPYICLLLVGMVFPTFGFAVEEFVWEEGEASEILKVEGFGHFGIFSLLPAAVTILLCFWTRKPLLALGGGVLSGLIVLGIGDPARFRVLWELLPMETIRFLFAFLLFFGIVLGLWSRNGAAHALADAVTQRFVRGPRSAKLVAWGLGLLFFQGGGLSALMVGAAVRPVADRQKVSHEELAYVVDATASPVSVLIPLNAWPFYVQSLLVGSGAAFLATEAQRVGFFFQAIPLFFFAWLSVFFTFLLAIDKLPFIGPGFRAAIKRARTTGEVNGPRAQPLAASGAMHPQIPDSYRPRALEFLCPLGAALLGLGVLVWLGALAWLPIALILAAGFAALVSHWRGLDGSELCTGVKGGLKAIAPVGAILLAAVLLGVLSQILGAGLWLVQWLGPQVPYWALPMLSFLLTFVIAFGTGTSWGTFAVTLPLVMPLAWAVGATTGLEAEFFFSLIVFAAAINGSIFGDQCSPISDTSILSSMATGCDLMDHVKTQIVPSSCAAVIALVGWTALVIVVV